MENKIVFGISFLAILLSIAWFLKDGGFEPAVTSLAGLAGMLHSLMDTKKTSSQSLPGGKDRPTPSRKEDSSRQDEASKVFKKGMGHVEEYQESLRKQLEAVIREADEIYFEIYEKQLREPDLLRKHPETAQRLQLSIIRKVGLSLLFSRCREQVKLRSQLGTGKDMDALWRREPDPGKLVERLSDAVHRLIRGERESFRTEASVLGFSKETIKQLVALAGMPISRLSQIDGHTNEHKRKHVEELIRIGAGLQ